MPARFGSMAASRRADGGKGGRPWPRPAGSPRPRPARRGARRPPGRAAPARSRPRSSSSSRMATPAAAVAADEVHRRTPSTASASARPSRSRTAASVDPFGATIDRSWSSIDSASRMPPAASRAMRWTAPGSAVRPSASRMRVELALDLGDRQAPDVEALEARQDRRREARGLGRGEHEDDEVGRLLERLEERVPGVLGDLVRLVEDVDLAAQLAGRVGEALAQVADGVDAAVAGGVDLDQVEGRALADRRRTTGSGRTASPSWRSVQLTALARIRASDVLPVPRGPTKRMACADPVRRGRRCGASRRPLPGRRSRRMSGRASGGRAPGAARSASRPPPIRGGRLESNCRAPSVDQNAPRAHHDERLGPGRSAAPDDDRLVLLPSGPDTVRGSPLRGTRSSTSLVGRHPRTETSGGDSALLERIAGTGHR